MCKLTVPLEVDYETEYDRTQREEREAAEKRVLERGAKAPGAAPPAKIWLQLRRYLADDEAQDRKPVLLVHGASANHGSFTTVDGGLAKYLAGLKFDPWLLDWRGSSLVIEDPQNEKALEAGKSFNFNAAASIDIKAALDRMEELGVKTPVAVMGHCMGGGILAEAIASGAVSPPRVHRVVLQTLGLFYQTPIDGRLKSEDRILERLQQRSRSGGSIKVNPRIDPRTGLPADKWPEELEDLYQNWPRRMFHEPEPLPDGKAENEAQPVRMRIAVNQQCNRVSFMYGMPYWHDNLAQGIHGVDGNPLLLASQFGAIPVHMYIHAAKNIRQGYATTYVQPATPTPTQSPPIVTDQARKRFMDLDKVTLITGALNRLWHRESIDQMYAWLTRGPSATARRVVQKHVLPDFGHQDLLWAPEDRRTAAYTAIAAALGW